MHISTHVLTVVVLAIQVSPVAAQETGASKVAPKILSARSAYFDDTIGHVAVREKALGRLRKWGRFQIVQDRKQADLIILLSADAYKGGYILLASGQTATIDKNGSIHEDSVPYYNRVAPVRYAYLTVIDPTTGESLWNESRRWGGLLTGFNSAGERLVKELEKQVKK